MFTFDVCFSSDCGLCSACCKGTGMYVSPYGDAFSEYQCGEAKEAVKKAEGLKKTKFNHLDIHDILGNVMGVKAHTIYIPLAKRIQKVNIQIEENKIKHRRWVKELDRENTTSHQFSGSSIDRENTTSHPWRVSASERWSKEGRREQSNDRENTTSHQFSGSSIRRLKTFSPDGLPDLTQGLTDVPYQDPDYNDKGVMRKIDIYRDQYWKDMEVLKNKYRFKDYKSIGTIPKFVTLNDNQYNKIKLPSDISLRKGAKFKLLNVLNYSCDNIQCLDMNSIYCAETRTLNIPMYTHDSQYEVCGLCLLGK
jgi:hypothetical protein